MADNGKEEYDKFMMRCEKAVQLMLRELNEFTPVLFNNLKEELQNAKELAGKTWDFVTDREARLALIEARHEAFNAGFSVFDKMDDATRKDFCDSLDRLSRFNKDTWQIDLTTIKALTDRVKDIRGIKLETDQKINPELIKGILKTREYALKPEPIKKAQMLDSFKKAADPIKRVSQAIGMVVPVVGDNGDRIR